jgi:hypothetical protein
MVLSDMFHVGAQGGSGEGSVVGGIPLITLVAAAARTAKSTIVGAAGCTMAYGRESASVALGALRRLQLLLLRSAISESASHAAAGPRAAAAAPPPRRGRRPARDRRTPPLFPGQNP